MENPVSDISHQETTPPPENPIKDFYLICSFSGFFALASVMISSMILFLVWRNKSRLHNVRHLLICNTSVASILYCIVQVINYIFLLFLPWETSDIACRWRGYLAYVTICGVCFSYLIQSISRLFISILSLSHRRLISFKTHYCLIALQWLFAIIIPLPAIITKDIYFRPNALCWVPLKDTLHVAYTYVMYYVIPVVSICGIYIYIYYRVKKARARAMMTIRSFHNEKRDLEVLRNILILLCIYLAGGISTMLFLITSNRVFYLIGIVTISLAVAVEKGCTILLDRDIRHVVRQHFKRTTQIVPVNNTATNDQLGILTLPQNRIVSLK